MFGNGEVNENWRKRRDEVLMQPFGDLVIRSLVRISRLNWIGQVKRMDMKRKISRLFNNNPKGR